MSEDRTSSGGASGDSDAKTCERCGTSIETADWYPIAAERDEEGYLDLYHFCSEDCRTAWPEEDSG